VIGSVEVRAEAENSPVDAGFGFALKKASIVVILEYKPLLDTVDHFARLLAGGIKAHIHQSQESVERKEQSWALIRSAPVTSRRLQREKLGSPAFGSNARPLGCDCVGRFISEVPLDLPTDSGIRVE
jgi:hypothetical protein